MMRIIGSLALATLLVSCSRASSPVPAPTRTVGVATSGGGNVWAAAGFSRDSDGANVYLLNTENGRVCEYLFFTLDRDSPPKRLVQVTCSSDSDTVGLSDQR